MSEAHPSIRVPVGPPAAQSPAAATTRDAAHRPTITPPIDIHEGPDGLTLEADLPGATESNLTIQLEHNVLSLDARIDAVAPEGGRLIHQEYPVGDYHRSFILSDDVDRERIAAELKDGVLKIFLPKADRARARRIEIQS
ncbi:Hsp20/alpha crystallin family protein [Paludisphaera mucosa]|uniref:Hsp20/alpha crystallin family protein n=1 Tax=Paludisphaera mucosa TaxID=3030827 RepID=A0ABT6F4G9_9BACT|nr:Hsp20/alpha crystallin family protein [Paludisphaera mucosa]MDG3002454.1 Hsp20/alpha crystallin family protein [Paludisphaera mucosa]